MNKTFGSELPDKMVIISDDVTAQTFLLACGILDKLTKPNCPANMSSEEIQTVICCHFTHQTHWILAFRYYGMENERENGFQIFAWPKNKWPKTVIKDAIDHKNMGIPIEIKNFTNLENDSN